MSSSGLCGPMLFSPIYKEKIWGGDALARKLGRALPGNAIGESWEISGYGEEQTTIIEGPMAGYTPGQLMKIRPEELLGSTIKTKIFPLLYKFIDANDKLSVQVHPDDAQARAHGWGDYGKTECWYVVDAKEDARIIVGFKKDVTREEITTAIESNTLDKLLNEMPVSSGDVLFIPAGTVHAILEGVLIYEVQETSDTTLRLYDWGRLDNGKVRELHISDALDVIDTMAHNRHRIEPVVIDQSGYKHAYRAACRYFSLEQYTFFRDMDIVLDEKQSFRVITVIGEALHIYLEQDETIIPCGSTVLIPSVCKEVTVAGTAGTRFLMSSVPDLAGEVVQPLKNLGIAKEAIALLGGNPEKNDLIPLL